ncbi:MAG: hypothetical protein OEV66_12780 [Spirochaetia bacterium]|nr:hypothetical protein [Spirochaetia bacterium]
MVLECLIQDSISKKPHMELKLYKLYAFGTAFKVEFAEGLKKY